MIVEIFVADHVGRNILRRRKPLFTSIALDVPLLKLVWLGERLRVIAHLIRSREGVLLTGPRVISLASRSCFGRAAFDGHSAGTAIRAYVNAIFTWAQNRECQIRSINLVAFVIFQMTHAQRRGALCHLDLDSLVCQVQERNGCLRREAKHAAAHVQLTSRALVGPELISSGEWTIRIRCHPV